MLHTKSFLKKYFILYCEVKNSTEKWKFIWQIHVNFCTCIEEICTIYYGYEYSNINMEEACLITWVYYLPFQIHSSDIINVSLFMKDMLCFYKKHIQETKKMTYLNIFLIVFEQERTRRKKERITTPPSTSGVIGCQGAIFLIISEP